MNLTVGLNFITGIMVGFEHVYQDDIHHFVFDILFVRIIIEVESGE